MKTQTNTNKMRKLVFVALASLTVMTTACSKNNGGGNPAPPPPVGIVPGCPIQPCVGGFGGAGGQMLYGGTTNGGILQSQFQVFGNPTGNGPASITGTVNINNYVCEVGRPNLSGPFTIQMTQPGQLTADVFTANVSLVGPQGAIPAGIEVVPSRTQGSGLFTLWLCGFPNDLNF